MLNPLVAVWMLIAIALILTLAPKKSIAAFLLACFTIPGGQVVVLGGVHFTVLRILILAGLLRRAMAGNSGAGKFPGGVTAVDRAAVLWTVSFLIFDSLQFMNSQAFIHNVGDFTDAIGGYLVIRSLITDSEAIQRMLKILALICVMQAVCMINEQITRINIFGLLGGIPLEVTIRDGKIRSNGVLGCLPAGVFAGTWACVFLWFWKHGGSRMVGAVGFLAAVAMVITSNSSTSYLALAGGLLGLAFWPLRKSMRTIRWGLSLILIALHLAMNAPVWALIARVDLTGASSGYHRMALVDNCIRHFSDWWLIGFQYYDRWGWDMWDLSNQFVAVALTGGLLTLAFYLQMFTRSFGAIGAARKQIAGHPEYESLLWCLGAALLAVVVASFGVNYAAPALMGLFPLFACISVVTSEASAASVQNVETPDEEELAWHTQAAGNVSWLEA